MRIGVPTEIKTREYRVGLTPASVRELAGRGHEVLVQKGAGRGAGFADEDFGSVGARLVEDACALYGGAELIVKVKEPQPSEWELLRPDHVLFAYLHLAADPDQARALKDSGCTAIAFETVEDVHGGLPLLAHMSEIAGRMAIQAGAHFLEKTQGGSGVLLGGVAGVHPGRVAVIGAGTVGISAARAAVGLGARVLLLDINLPPLRAAITALGERIATAHATTEALSRAVAHADLVVGAVLVTGGKAPRVITEKMVRAMRPGSVIVDVAIDQGGCVETGRPTTHDDPVHVVHGVSHYAVTNIPGAVPRTATQALNAAVLPHALALADHGVEAALDRDRGLRAGLNVRRGRLVHPVVARALGETVPPP